MSRPNRRPSDTVFDIDANWHLLQPHLNDAWVLETLERAIMDYIRQHPNAGPWDSTRGPWSYSPMDVWHQEAERRLTVADPDWNSRLAHFDDSKEGNSAWAAAYDQLTAPYFPQPDTPEWYMPHGLCHWIAGWTAALVKTAFPDQTISILYGHEHSTVVTGGPNGTSIIYDILRFRTDTPKAIFRDVGRPHTVTMITRGQRIRPECP